MRRIVRYLIVVLVILYGCAGLVSWRLTRRFETTPVAHHPNAETIELTTTDEHEIRAWWFDVPTSTTTAVIIHGNGGSRRSVLPITQALLAMNVAVLAVTARAHGDSSGEVNDFGYSARNDVIAAVQYAEDRRPGAPIVVVGRSLGAAASVFAAPTLRNRVVAYVLESPYASIDIATKNRTNMFLPEPISSVTAWSLTSWSRIWTGVPTDVIAPIDYAAKIPTSVPVVIIAGDRDRRATLDEMNMFRDRLSGHVVLEVFEDATHSAPWFKDRSRYIGILRRTVERFE